MGGEDVGCWGQGDGDAGRLVGEMGVVALAVREGSELKEFSCVCEAGEVLKVVWGNVFEEFMFTVEKLVEEGVQPGARSGSTRGVVDGGKGEVVFALDEYGCGGTVSPELLRVGVSSRGRGDGNDELVFVGVGCGELGARGYGERVLVGGSLAGDAVVRKCRGVEKEASGLVGHFVTCAGGLDGVSEFK